MDNPLQLWHSYRLHFFAAGLSCVAILQVWFYIHRRWKQPTQVRLAGSHLREKAELKSQTYRDTSNDALDVFSRRKINPSPEATEARTPKSRSIPKRIVGKRPRKNIELSPVSQQKIQPLVFYCSISGSVEKHAARFTEQLSLFIQSNSSANPNSLLEPRLLDLSYIEYDDYFITPPQPEGGGDHDKTYVYILLLPTYNIDSILNTFLEHLRETHHDFRIDTAPLSGLQGYSVFGFGDGTGWPTEAEGFCSQASEVDRWLARLTGRKRAYPVGMGDVTNNAVIKLDEWRKGLENILSDLASGKTLGEGIPGSGDAIESDEDDEEVLGSSAKRTIAGSGKQNSTLQDLETLGGSVNYPLPLDFTTSQGKTAIEPPVPKEMVPKSSPTYAALTKQGYTIVGSHSGVKICRWTKSALRGRGSCYKFSFYGIKSHLCMETTPSLSCSNKCVFCWRHGTNPVGTTWRWQVDPPELIFEGVKKGHYAKIKMMRGVPGVRAERFEEAMRIKHCALSLVGEPIFYPYINEFVAMLHKERISSFLVCNAQHPDQLATLQRVTQLYVSIDASNRESLRKIDRPLHRDFWERFCRCLDILREKRFQQRTVFRLTLVKGFNIEDEAEGYADLVARGLPCFVEIKGVTYCGTSTSAGAGLTMKNVPFYEEVCTFVTALNGALERRGLDYGIAAEHAHSCCVLIASKRFLRDGKWHTVIDYGRFFELLDSGRDFAPEDYMAPTLEWALFGNGGFDPSDERVFRGAKKKGPAQIE